MRESTIAKQRGWGAGGEFARTLGSELRRLRLGRGMTQSDLGRPLTRAFVSSVESGRTVPSLAALLHMVERLDLPPGAVLEDVYKEWTDRYAREHAEPDTPPHRRR